MMAWWVNGLALLVSVTVFSFIGYFLFAVFITPTVISYHPVCCDIVAQDLQSL